MGTSPQIILNDCINSYNICSLQLKHHVKSESHKDDSFRNYKNVIKFAFDNVSKNVIILQFFIIKLY